MPVPFRTFAPATGPRVRSRRATGTDSRRRLRSRGKEARADRARDVSRRSRLRVVRTDIALRGDNDPFVGEQIEATVDLTRAPIEAPRGGQIEGVGTAAVDEHLATVVVLEPAP